MITREQMIEAVAASENHLPAMVRGLAFVYLNNMSDDEVAEVGELIETGIIAIHDQDFERFDELLKNKGVPGFLRSSILDMAKIGSMSEIVNRDSTADDRN